MSGNYNTHRRPLVKQFVNKHANETYQKQVYLSCKDLVQNVPVCPTCHFPRGQGGWLRRDLPVGHPDFGKPVACPTCNSGPPF